MAKDFLNALSKEKKEEKVQESGSFVDTLKKSEDGSLFPDEADESVLNIILFSFDGISFSVAKKLIDEGNNVVVAQIKNKKDIGEEGTEDAEIKRRRLSLYDGIFVKHDALKVLEQMKSIKNKDKWIVFFDFNNLSVIAEKALEMGFKKGLFPLASDTELEKDRDSAKDIVKEYYPDITVAEVQEFTSIQDAIQMLQDTEQLWVLKGNSDAAKTLVPSNDDPELAKKVIIDALEAHQKDYEDGGFILEEKIVNGYELTPQIVFLNGKPVFTDIDIENKNIGAGNTSIQTGAMQTLVIKTKLKDRINDIAFPDWIYQKAKEHTGLFVADAGLICKDDKYYFTEFCFQRFGYDSFFAEIAMSNSATDFFRNMFNGRNPLKNDFGVAVRALNMHKDDKERRVLEGISMTVDDEKDTYVFECKGEDEKLVCTGCAWDFVVFTGVGETVNKAVEEAYEAAGGFAFEDLYMRPKFDFISYEYQNSIPNRFNKLNHDLFEATDMEDHGKFKIAELQRQIEQALNDEE